MIEWKQKFEQDTLERGRTSYLNKRVDGLKKVSGGYEAAVLGRERFEVSVKIGDNQLGRMRCSCPASKGGRNCEHMAAVLYAIEGKATAAEEKQTEADLMEQWRKMDEMLHQEEVRKKEEQEEAKRLARKKQKEQEEARRMAEERRRMEEEKRRAEEQERLEEERRKMEQERRKTEFTLLGSPWVEEEDTSDLENASKNMEELETYSYFNGSSIRKSMEIPKNAFQEGERLLAQGRLQIKRVLSGYDRSSNAIRGQVEAVGKSGNSEFPVSIIFSRTEVVVSECGWTEAFHILSGKKSKSDRGRC